MELSRIVEMSAEMLKILSENDGDIDDWKYVPMYREYVRMRKDRVKYNIAIEELAKKNMISKSKTETVMVISHATDAEQMYDTIQHETRHAADNIGEYYGLPPRGEESAYLQGEISRKMFVAAAMSVCPKCNHRPKYYRYGLQNY